MGVMLHAVNAGWTFGECERAFLQDPGSALWLTGEDDRRLRWAQSFKRLREDHRKAVERVSASPAYRGAGEARQRVGELIELAARQSWPGVAGRTDRAVLAAIHRLATEVGTTVLDADQRTLSSMAGRAQQTVSIAIRWLRRAGWLQRQGLPENWRNAYTYRLTQPEVLRTESYHSLTLRAEGCMTTPATPHEVWLHLGPAAQAVYHQLDHYNPQSKRALARAAHVDPSTVIRRLPVLVEHKLARQAELAPGKGNWLRGFRSLDEVARLSRWTGVGSRAERRADTYEIQRAEWREEIAFVDAHGGGKIAVNTRTGENLTAAQTARLKARTTKR
jgi:hypothetical protein